MSTHAIVGMKTPTGFRGRYVHFDGYPANMVNTLRQIIGRDGWKAAAEVLTEKHTSWQFLSLEPRPARDGEVGVLGFGVADLPPHDEDRWFYESDRRGPAHWAYALSERGIEVWRCDQQSQVWTRTPEHDVLF